MNRGIYTTASGGIAALAQLESVSQNLANVGTAGYKAERLIFQVRPLGQSADGVPEPGTLGLDPVLGQTAAQVMSIESVRDFSQGSVRLSGNPLDVAITGDGFFAVETARGERYTRQGTFSIDREGFLVTALGDRVQGDGGDVQLGNGEVVIAQDGTVTVDRIPTGRLKLVSFGERPRLVPEGSALYAPLPNTEPVPIEATAVRLQPGATEASNADAVTSLVELVEVARGYESYMQAMRRLDEITERTINDVGRV
jgi:flagellar basal-body rod protein FlgG